MTRAPAGTPESSPTTAPRRRRRLTILLPVLLALGAMFGVGAAAYSRGAEDDTAARPAGVSNPLGQQTTANSAHNDASASSDAGIGQAPVKISIAHLLMSKDATGLQQTSLPVTVTNTGPLTHSFDITIAAYTKDGQRITMDTGTAANLRPGQTANLRVLEIVNDKLVAALKDAHFQVESVFTY